MDKEQKQPKNADAGDAKVKEQKQPKNADAGDASVDEKIINQIAESDERGVPLQIDCLAHPGDKCIPKFKIQNLDKSWRYACNECSGPGNERLAIVTL